MQPTYYKSKGEHRGFGLNLYLPDLEIQDFDFSCQMNVFVEDI